MKMVIEISKVGQFSKGYMVKVMTIVEPIQMNEISQRECVKWKILTPNYWLKITPHLPMEGVQRYQKATMVQSGFPQRNRYVKQFIFSKIILLIQLFFQVWLLSKTLSSQSAPQVALATQLPVFSLQQQVRFCRRPNTMHRHYYRQD